MSSIAKFYIQLFVATSLMGFWLTNALCTFLIGDTSPSVSIAYRAILLIMSIIAIAICRHDVRFDNSPFFKWYTLIMVLYAFRMIYDAAFGPFADILPISAFITNFLYTVVGAFFTTFAIITCRNNLNLDTICKLVYLIGLAIILLVPYIVDLESLSMEDSTERMDAGRGLSTLALAKVGAIEVIVALHLLLNNRLKILYLPGLILGIWLCLSSGSRGGAVALIIALGLYCIIRYRHNILLSLIIISSIILVALNLESILEWLSEYFPVFSNRMLDTIIDNDQSGREELRELAYQRIMDNPIMGYSYRLNPTETGYYCHNGLLDILLTFGIPFGLFCIYITHIKPLIMTYKLIDYKKLFFVSVMTLWVIIHSLSGIGFTDITFSFAVCMMAAYYYSYTKQ